MASISTMSLNTTPLPESDNKVIQPISSRDTGLKKDESTELGPFRLAIQKLPKHLLKPRNVTDHQTAISNDSKEDLSSKTFVQNIPQNCQIPFPHRAARPQYHLRRLSKLQSLLWSPPRQHRLIHCRFQNHGAAPRLYSSKSSQLSYNSRSVSSKENPFSYFDLSHFLETMLHFLSNTLQSITNVPSPREPWSRRYRASGGDFGIQEWRSASTFSHLSWLSRGSQKGIHQTLGSRSQAWTTS